MSFRLASLHEFTNPPYFLCVFLSSYQIRERQNETQPLCCSNNLRSPVVWKPTNLLFSFMFLNYTFYMSLTKKQKKEKSEFIRHVYL